MKIEGVRDKKSEQLFNLTKLGKPWQICNFCIIIRFNNFDNFLGKMCCIFSQASIFSQVIITINDLNKSTLNVL